MDKMQTKNNINDSGAKTSSRVLLILMLVFIALAISTARYLWHQPGGAPTGDSIWSVTLEAHFNATDAGAVVKISPPWDTRHARFYGQTLFHPNMRQQRIKDKRRDIVLIVTKPGRLLVNAKFDLHISLIPQPKLKQLAPMETNRSIWLSTTPGIPVEISEFVAILDTLSQDKPEISVLVNRIFEHISERIRITPNGVDDGGSAFVSGQGSALGMTHSMVALLRTAHLPARVITGLDLLSTEDKQPKYWAEVYYEDRWHPLDIVNGHRGELPPTYIPLRKGGNLVIDTINAQLTDIRWHIEQAIAPRGLLVSDTPHYYDFMDLSRLSPSTREIIGLLLLLPLGALSTEILREFIGIRTYGTFTPTLLALATVYVDWVTATSVFALVTGLGVAGRALLANLELTREARLSVVFTLVAVFMALVVSLLMYFNPLTDSAVVLLPIVILTTLVDRIYTVADENGLRVAMLRLGWTVGAALLSLAILLQAHWGEWLLTYPEMHAITLAIIVYLGWYHGRSLADLRWFLWLQEPKKRSSSKRNKDINHPPEQSGEVK